MLHSAEQIVTKIQLLLHCFGTGKATMDLPEDPGEPAEYREKGRNSS